VIRFSYYLSLVVTAVDEPGYRRSACQHRERSGISIADFLFHAPGHAPPAWFGEPAR
jgi:hypothetical protein